MKICFATNNPHKLREVRALVPSSIQIISLSEIGCKEELPETGKTLEENSLQKAKFILDNFRINCFADDTGLEVVALDGKPGVFSARYAGLPPNPENNIKKLLGELDQIENRKACFRTIITLLIDGEVHNFEGKMEGEITLEPKGDNGFGYDPVFLPEGFRQTFAEMDSQLKNRISHRGNAVRKLTAFLSKKLSSE